MTAPAALATIGITALGGLVLSPFGADPGAEALHPAHRGGLRPRPRRWLLPLPRPPGRPH